MSKRKAEQRLKTGLKSVGGGDPSKSPLITQLFFARDSHCLMFAEMRELATKHNLARNRSNFRLDTLGA